MAVHKELGLVRESPLNGPLGYYTAACIVTTLIGFMTGHVNGMTGFFFVLKYIEYFVVYFIVINNVQSRSHILQFTVALLLTAFIVSIVAMAQLPAGGRVSAPFEGDTEEPNTLGGYLLLMGAVGGGLLLHMKGSIRYVLVAFILTILLPFAYTQSRGSYLGLPFVYGTFILLDRKRRFLLIIFIILAGGLGWEMMPPEVKDRIMYTFNQTKQSGQTSIGGTTLDTSTSARLTSYTEAMEDFQSSPIWGFGVTGYGFLDAQYPRVLVETGLLGGVTFGIMILAVFKQAINLLKRATDGLYKGLALGLIAGLVGLLVHALGANTFIIVRIMEPFWLLVGLVVSAAKLEEEKVEAAKAAAEQAEAERIEAGETA